MIALTSEGADSFGWTKKAGTLLVHPDHWQELSRYTAAVQRRGRTLLLMVAGVNVAMMGFSFLLLWRVTWGLLGMAAAAAAFGGALFVWPLVTPETVRLMGARKGIFIARCASGVLVGAGIWLLWLALRS